MAEFDFPGWVARARAFTIGIGRLTGGEVRTTTVAPPIAEPDMQEVERALRATIPASLRTFFTRGAAALDCAYAFKPEGQALDQLRALLPDETSLFGGARLGPASELADYCDAAREWAKDTWIADFADQRRIWESALPFLRLDTGDYLALDMRSDASEPPVAYLSHDDESFPLAPNLVVFLTAWERLCYLGPEHWLLHPFTDDTGHLNAESERATRLRELVGRRGAD